MTDAVREGGRASGWRTIRRVAPYLWPAGDRDVKVRVVAAMVALVNDARMRAGKPSLGWLNPLLYSDKVRGVLRDVTVGNSRGCRFLDGTDSPGWSSVVGYDCVTGLGVVDDFNDFLAALL
jgi:tripeptidyl-peptidase-1